LLILFAVSLTGCGDGALPPFAGSPYVSVVWPKDELPVGGTSTSYGTWDNEIAYVVWSDLPQEWVGISNFDHNRFRTLATLKVAQEETDGRKIRFESQMRQKDAEREGSLTFGGARYALADGAVFLVTTRGGPPQVRQVKVDLRPLKPRREDLVELARRDPEIGAFLTQAAR
jgi:hypothetical protein